MKTLIRQLDEIFEKEPNEDAMIEMILAMEQPVQAVEVNENDIPF